MTALLDRNPAAGSPRVLRPPTTPRRHGARRQPVLAVVGAVVGLLAVSAAPAAAAPVDGVQQTWGTNGRVAAILADPVNDRVYVAGNFSAVTDADGTTQFAAGNFAVFNPLTGQFDSSWDLDTDFPVTALARSGGRLYLGGDFTSVDGERRTRLAAVDVATGELDPTWKPAAKGGPVRALAVSAGKVYVGGKFVTLGGAAQPFLGRVSATGTGAVDAGWAPRLDARVRTLAVSPDGTRLYAGGDFTTVNNNTAGMSIASINTTTATLTTGFNAGPTNDGRESPAVDLDLDGSLLLAATAGTGGGCASLDAATGKTRWSKHANGNMQAVTALNGTVYCGGHFGGLGAFANLVRYKLAAVDESSGAVVENFAPRINSPLGVWSLDHDASRLFVGGDFTRVNGPQSHFAVFR